jgi:hypothetical protein
MVEKYRGVELEMKRLFNDFCNFPPGDDGYMASFLFFIPAVHQYGMSGVTAGQLEPVV